MCHQPLFNLNLKKPASPCEKKYKVFSILLKRVLIMEIVYFNDFIDLTKAFIDLLKLLYENWELYDDIFFFSFL